MTALRWPDARGFIGLGIFGLTVMVFAMTAAVPELRNNEYFKTLGTLVVGAFIKDVVGWAYSATKAGGELAERNASLVEKQASANNGPTGAPGDPVNVKDASEG